MRFDSDSIDLSGVSSSEGSGGGMGVGLPGGLAVGGSGISIVGLLIWALASGFFGSSVPALTGPGVQSSQSQSSGDLSHCTTRQAQETQVECRLVKTYDVANNVWKNEFARAGISGYTRPRLQLFSGRVSTRCGAASEQMGPFYCPADSTIYFSPTFLQRLQKQVGAPGDFAQAYIVAHEFGHHIQNITGTERQVRRTQQGLSEAQANQYSVAMELQADCYAGVWATLAQQSGDGIELDPGDIDEGLQAAQAVGDDALQEQATGRVNPEAFTHGSSAQRKQWLETGMREAKPSACNTFAAMNLPLK